MSLKLHGSGEADGGWVDRFTRHACERYVTKTIGRVDTEGKRVIRTILLTDAAVYEMEVEPKYAVQAFGTSTSGSSSGSSDANAASAGPRSPASLAALASSTSTAGRHGHGPAPPPSVAPDSHAYLWPSTTSHLSDANRYALAQSTVLSHLRDSITSSPIHAVSSSIAPTVTTGGGDSTGTGAASDTTRSVSPAPASPPTFPAPPTIPISPFPSASALPPPPSSSTGSASGTGTTSSATASTSAPASSSPSRLPGLELGVPTPPLLSATPLKRKPLSDLHSVEPDRADPCTLHLYFFSGSVSRRMSMSLSRLKRRLTVDKSFSEILKCKHITFVSALCCGQWLLLLQRTIRDVWQKTLEAQFVPAPEIYQRHAFVIKDSNDRMLVVSTQWLYNLEVTSKPTVVRGVKWCVPVSAIESVQLPVPRSLVAAHDRTRSQLSSSISGGVGIAGGTMLMVSPPMSPNAGPSSGSSGSSGNSGSSGADANVSSNVVNANVAATAAAGLAAASLAPGTGGGVWQDSDEHMAEMRIVCNLDAARQQFDSYHRSYKGGSEQGQKEYSFWFRSDQERARIAQVLSKIFSEVKDGAELRVFVD